MKEILTDELYIGFTISGAVGVSVIYAAMVYVVGLVM